MSINDLSTAFKSKRLVYRAFENNYQDRHFIHTEIENDPVNSALSNPSILRPRSQAQTDSVLESLAKSTLAVMVCLPPPPPPPLHPHPPPSEGTVDMPNEEHSASAAAAADRKVGPEPTPIGYVVLGWGGGPPESRAQHRSIGIGITLAAAYQGQGYGGEALNWALDWAFRFGGYHRVEIGTVSYNERAVHLYRRLGFVEEGRSRKAFWHDRRWYDAVNFGMLEEEWEALRGLGT